MALALSTLGDGGSSAAYTRTVFPLLEDHTGKAVTASNISINPLALGWLYAQATPMRCIFSNSEWDIGRRNSHE
jgi:hypothetical protein